MIKFRAFSRFKKIFTRLNPIPFGFGNIEEKIEKVPGSDELLEKAIRGHSNFQKVILIAIYHLMNTQDVTNEYLTILTKDLRLICDLVEGDGEGVEIPDDVNNEPVENILLTCHNHFQRAVIPSSKDFRNIIKPKIKFTIIVSEEDIAIIVNDLNDQLYFFSNSEKQEFKNTWKTYKEYIMFCLAKDYPNVIFKFYNDEYSEGEFQKFFERYVGENISKFVDEFNVRFKKYNIYCIHIKI